MKYAALFSDIERIVPTLTGWCTPEKASDFASVILALQPAVAVEIGVWGGRGTIAVALAMKAIGKGVVYGIDPWDAPESVKGQEGPNAKWWGSVNHEDVYRAFLLNVKNVGVANHVDVMRMPSDRAQPPHNIGLLISDGNHGEQAVRDVDRFAPRVCLGGFVYLDDLDWTGGAVRVAEKHLLEMGFIFLRQIDCGAMYQRTRISP